MTLADPGDRDDEVEVPCAVEDAIASWRRILGSDPDDKGGVLFRAAAELLALRRQQYDVRLQQYITDAIQHLAWANGFDDLASAELIARAAKAADNAQDIARNDSAKGSADIPALDFLKPSDWEGQPVPERLWLVPQRIPLGAVTILSGDGAAGKTTIALQLVEATAAGSDWLDSVIEHQGPAVFMTGEEDSDEIHRRFVAICRHRGKLLSDLTDIDLLCLPDEDAVLGAVDHKGQVKATPLYNALLAYVIKRRPALIVIEAAADTFSGNENDRTQARQYIALLRRLALRSGAAVVLIAHPSLTGLTSGSGTSGSTAWNNSARSRLYFRAAKKSEDDDPDLRELEVKKSNYGPAGEIVRLRWQCGAFVLASKAVTPERMAAEREIEEKYLRCLDTAHAVGHDLSTSPNASNYAPKVFVKMPLGSGVSEKAFAAAQERLLMAGRIEIRTDGPPSKRRKRFYRKFG
jgi:RecA-family ATPase